MLEQSLHVQNAVQLCGPHQIFILDESQTMSQKLPLIGWCCEAASTIGPHHSQETCNLPVSVAQHVELCYVFLTLLGGTQGE
jgi:hypothetical protein